MSDAATIYADILNSNLNSKNQLARIMDEARKLRTEGQLEVAKDLVNKALAGAALFPHQKQELRDFAEAELQP